MTYKDNINDIATDFFADRVLEMIKGDEHRRNVFLKLPKQTQELVLKNMIDSMFENNFEELFGEGSEFYKKMQPILDKEIE